MGYIYLVTNLINGKKYVGQTTRTIEKRWKEHQEGAFISRLDFYFYKALRKYGIENFEIKEIEQCSNELLDEKEIEYIEYYKSFYIYRQGYNLTRGGKGGSKINRNGIIKLWNQGYSAIEIARQFNVYIRGVTDTLKAIGIAQEEIYHRSQVYAQRYRLKKIYQYDYQGRLMNIYEDLNDMVDKTGYSRDYIGAACNHKYATANGYLWKYEDDDTLLEDMIKNIPPDQNHPVLQYNKEGILIREYKSLSEAERENNFSKGFLNKVIKEAGHTAGDCFWIEKNDPAFTIEQHLNAFKNRYIDRKRRIAQYDLNGNFIREYESVTDAAKQLGKESSRAAINRVINGKQKTSCGYIWKLV